MITPLTNRKSHTPCPGQHDNTSRPAKLSLLSTLSLMTSFAAGLLLAPAAMAQENADLENGKYMFTIAGCGSCHGKKDDPTKLTGGYEIKTDFGTFVTPNISMDPEAGIGKWSRADFYTALKEGISPRGSHYYPTFPYASYAGMSKKDIFDIFEYIKTLPTIAAKAVEHNLSFPYNLRNSIGLWKIAAALPDSFTPTNGESDLYNRGKYLVEHVAHCGECHTPRTSLFQTLDQTRRFEGNTLPNGESAPGITAKKLQRKGLDAFLKSMTEGLTLRGKPMDSKGMLKVVDNMKTLSEEDHKAMFSYLAEEDPVDKPEAVVEAQPVAITTPEPVIASTDNVLTNDTEQFFAKYCSNCHGSGGKVAAQKDFKYTNLQTLALDASLITPGDPEKSDIYLSVVDGTMPKHGERPTTQEVAALSQWIKDLKKQAPEKQIAAAPEAEAEEPAEEVAAPGDEESTDQQVAENDAGDEGEQPAEQVAERTFLSDEAIHKAILNDLIEVSEFDRKTTRYIAHTHLYNAAPEEVTEAQVQANLTYFNLATAKLINSLSNAPKLHKPEVVEGTNGTVLRINIHDLDWDAEKWREIEKLYPYAIHGEKGDALKQLQNITHSVAPVLRSDWFAFTSSRAPLYNTLLDLPDTLGGVEKMLGIDANRNIDKGDVIRAAFTDGQSGVSDHNRLIERHDLPRGGYYWKSYDFGGSDGERSLLQNPFGPKGVHNLPDGATPFVHDGGEVFWQLANGLQAYYLSDGEDKFIPSGPTFVVRDHTRPPGLGIEVINAASCMSCHADGIIFKRDELREFADNSSSFTVDQMKFLKELYPGKAKLREVYKDDQKAFIAALLKLGIGRELEDGRFENISVITEGAKNPREIIGYLADQYQHSMDQQRVAAEFGLEADQFNNRIEAIPARYGDALSQGLRVRDLLRNGQRLMRNQFEQLYPIMVAGMTGFETARVEVASGDKKETHKADLKVEKVVLTAKDRIEKKTKRLNLVVKVPKNTFHFGETLTFTVSTSKTCELNIIYKQADGSIVTLPPEMSGEKVLGDPILKAGETRHLPVSDAVKLRFAPPAGDEELFVQCRAGGLKDHRVDEKKIEKIKQEFSDEYATRGLRIEIDKHAEPERQIHDATSIKFHVTSGKK